MTDAATDSLTRAQAELEPLLTGALRSPAALDAMAARSYAHDNGFFKIVLARRRDYANALRLHVWPGDSEDEGNIHNHCWDYDSLVLAGELEFQEYELDNAGFVPAVHYAYAATGDLAYELRPFGRRMLRPTESGRRRTGERYRMTAETLHRTWGSAGTTTVTLLVQGAHRREHADVYVTRPDGVPTENVSESMSSERLRPLLAALQDLVATART